MSKNRPSCTLDFETYSEAGYEFDIITGKWRSADIFGSGSRSGLELVGAHPYAEHYSTEILVLRYRFKGSTEIRYWRPGGPPPLDLIEHASKGGILCAWNAMFEYYIWNENCVKKYGWPPLSLYQMRDDMAAAMAWSLPVGLDKALGILTAGAVGKDKKGKNLIKKLSVPRNQTKTDRRIRLCRGDTAPNQKAQEKEGRYWNGLDEYCATDVVVEDIAASMVPPLTDAEQEVWRLTSEINARGIRIDTDLVKTCIHIFKIGKIRAGEELSNLTGGKITSVSQATAIRDYINQRWPGKPIKDLRPETISEFRNENPLPEILDRILEIRSDAAGNSPAKLFAMINMQSKDGRVRNGYAFCGAQRTRRYAGRGMQPQNLPKEGPEMGSCDDCRIIFRADKKYCPKCNRELSKFDLKEWNYSIVETIIPFLREGKYDTIDRLFGNPLKIIAGCLRAMLISDPDKEFVCSDFSSIEAVVMACLAGEQWIIDVFKSDRKLYERTASKITGIPIEEILEYKKIHKKHHPKRKLGKVGSLASQFQGARGAWLRFGAGKFLSNKEIDEGVRSWRKANPAIVNFWYACEDSAIKAVKYPGYRWDVKRLDGFPSGISYQMNGRALYCFLPSGDWLTYVDPEINLKKKLSSEGWKLVEAYEAFHDSEGGAQETYNLQKVATHISAGDCLNYLMDYDFKNKFGKFRSVNSIKEALTQRRFFVWGDSLSYWGVGANQTWSHIETYGGKLAENIIQAVSRFLQTNAMTNINPHYPVVIHSHDEIVGEVPKGYGSVENFEERMSRLPVWAVLPNGEPWPIKAMEGWRGTRYRK